MPATDPLHWPAVDRGHTIEIAVAVRKRHGDRGEVAGKIGAGESWMRWQRISHQMVSATVPQAATAAAHDSPAAARARVSAVFTPGSGATARSAGREGGGRGRRRGPEQV